MRPPTPPDEAERLRALYELKILDTPPEPDFDDMVALASQICGAPMSLVNLIDADRQWSKAGVGVGVGVQEVEIPREMSFCAHAILGRDLMVVPDATADARFADNPLVVRRKGIRFYAGAPLITTEGYALGALCVIDATPRRLALPQLKALRALSRQVITQLELRRFTALLARGTTRLRELERHLDDLGRLAGRLREPLSALRACLTAPTEPCVRDAVSANAIPLRQLVDDLLALVGPAPAAVLHQREVDLSPLTQRAADAVRPIADAKRMSVLCTSVTPTPVRADPVRLEQALSHLLFNAVKHSPEGGRLEVYSGLEGGPTVRLRTPDIVVDDPPSLFSHFYREALVRPPDADSPRGLGTVKAIFDAHHATVAMSDRLGDGTSLQVVFPAAHN
jgi:signal transduction histidine kinase